MSDAQKTANFEVTSDCRMGLRKLPAWGKGAGKKTRLYYT